MNNLSAVWLVESQGFGKGVDIMAIEFGSKQAERVAHRDKLIDSPVWGELKAIYQEMSDLKDQIKTAESRIKDLENKARDTRRKHKVSADDELFYMPHQIFEVYGRK